jgi:LSD1 subclass zinc finger protein
VPVVTCPKCPTKLRVPDGATGNVKCPKCNTIFPAAAAAEPMFEVVDEAPAKPSAKPVARVTAKVSDDDDDDRPRKKRRDDDDDDRPRKKRRDDDDDDDRPRSKRRRDDDDDDDDDRGRRKKRRRDYDDDDDDDYRPPKKGNSFGHGKTGALLISIGMWLYMGMFGLLGLFFLLLLVTTIPDGLMAIAGICGVGCTILTIVGTSFCIAGPSKARGLAIATVSVAGAHLILVAISYNNLTGGLGRGGLGAVMPGADWVLLGTSIWILDLLLPGLIYGGAAGGASGELILMVLAGACELTRMIMVCLTLKAMATAAKDYTAADKSGKSVMVTCVVCGAAAIGSLLLVVILNAMGPPTSRSSAKFMLTLGGLGMVAICVGYALMALTGAFAAMETKDSMASRARRR